MGRALAKGGGQGIGGQGAHLTLMSRFPSQLGPVEAAGAPQAILNRQNKGLHRTSGNGKARPVAGAGVVTVLLDSLWPPWKVTVAVWEWPRSAEMNKSCPYNLALHCGAYH